MDVISIKNMKIKERLIVMQDIWESLLYDEADIETPEWHSSVINKRKNSINDGAASFISIESLKKNSK